MEGKVKVMIFTLILLIAVSLGANHYHLIKTGQTESSDTILQAQTLVDTAKLRIEDKQRDMASTSKKLAAITALIDGDAERQSLEQQIKQLQAERAKALDDFSKAVAQVRVLSAGLKCPDITLANGQAITGVTIQRVMDAEVSLAHSQGVAKVKMEDLPEDIKARFRWNMVPFTEAPK